MSVKKIVNNSSFIPPLAEQLDGPEAAALAKAARTYRDIVKGLGIVADLKGFKGCDQGQLLWSWVYGGVEPDTAKMKEWTAFIEASIKDLADGKLPTEDEQ